MSGDDCVAVDVDPEEVDETPAGLRILQSLLQQESALGGGDMLSRPAVPTLAGLIQDPTRGRAVGSAGSMAGVIIAEPPVGGPAAKTS